MALRFLLFFMILFGALVAKSQTLLNLDSARIKKEMISQGGVLRASLLENGFEVPGYYHDMIFLFPNPTNEDDGIFSMQFFLSLKNRCFKYYVKYYGDSSIGKIKKMLKSSPGLKQIKDSLKWVNHAQKYEMRVLPRLPVNGKMAPVYYLEIKNK